MVLVKATSLLAVYREYEVLADFCGYIGEVRELRVEGWGSRLWDRFDCHFFTTSGLILLSEGS